MQLIDIVEPEDGVNHNEYTIGIDLGTTNSLVAYSQDQKPVIIKNILGNKFTPSIVNIVGGKIELSKQNLDNQCFSVKSIKRLMGRTYDEAISLCNDSYLTNHLVEHNKELHVKIENALFTPEEISSTILKQLKLSAQAELNCEIKNAIITVPAYFNDAARNATKKAAILAGLNPIRLISEPTAAAYAYGLDKNSQGIFAVYDLGGGTFDVSILRIKAGIFQVIATGGDNLLGGDDIDVILAKHIFNQIDIDKNNYSFLDLISHAKNIKEMFSDYNEVSYKFSIGGKEFNFIINITDFNSLIAPIINKTIKILSNVIMDSGLSKDDILGIILVGGSSRIKLIKDEITKSLNITILDDVNPDEVVALGAALQAENLTSNNNNLLIDVIPLSLGIELIGGLVEIIIPRNIPLPIKLTKNFTTYQDNQTAMSFHIVQGDRPLAKDCRSLARFELKNIMPMRAGLAKVEVTFAIDADGIMAVAAHEKNTDCYEQIEIASAFDLEKDVIIEMLKSANSNFESDSNQKLLAETLIEANYLINRLEKIISHKDKKDEKLSYDIKKLTEILQELKTLVASGDRVAILSQIDIVKDFLKKVSN